ncbi:MAG: hypothetical protein WBD47_10625 [Phormidesmis sp.]
MNFFTGKQTLSIRRRSRSNGTTQWIVYDPHRNDRHVFDSEQAVRAWLETQYGR